MHAHANVDISASSGGVPPSPTSPTGILKKSSGQPVYKSSKFDKKCIGDGLVFFAFGSRLSLLETLYSAWMFESRGGSNTGWMNLRRNSCERVFHEISFMNLKTFIETPAELRALSSPPTTPLKGDTSLPRSQSSSAKVKRRSRSKSPFRSFRWKRSSTANEQDQSDEEEGISFAFLIS